MKYLIAALLLLLPLAKSTGADLSVEIVPTEVLTDVQRLGVFYVIITNTSKSDLAVWRESCSWGYESLTFTVTFTDGKSATISKEPIDWFWNSPDPYLLRPGKHYVRQVDFSTGEWAGFSKDWREGKVSIIAHFAQSVDRNLNPTHYSPLKGLTIWYGKVSSEEIKVTLADVNKLKNKPSGFFSPYSMEPSTSGSSR